MSIDQCLAWYPINPGLSNREVLSHLLGGLASVLTNGVPGDVVELGCHAGETSIFFARMIQLLDSTRCLHLYDSFQGLPERHVNDNHLYGEPGSVKTDRQIVVDRFRSAWLPQPHIHPGWFSEIPDDRFPDKIAFAFFDGDLYQSIWDSFVRVYPRLSPGAIVFVHDYAVSNWPGTQRASEEFLADKPEKMTNPCFLLGKMVKQ